MPRLKVFRTAIGFHDVHVAASSRKAALAAWGSDKDLFARGVAEEVTDPALAAEALAAPGTVIRRSRGTAAEQFAALPPETPKRAKTRPEEDPAPTKARIRAAKAAAAPPPPPPKPQPSRETLDDAEAAVAKAKRLAADALASLAERERALARERRALERAQADDLRRLTRARDAAQNAFDAAMRRWRATATG